MESQKLRMIVIDTLRDLIEEGAPIISDNTNPISELGLTSDDGLDFACIISEKLGFHIDEKVNPFICDDGDEERNVSKIIALVKQCGEQTVEVTNE